MKMEIEIDEACIPKGWRVIRVGAGKAGEIFIDSYGKPRPLMTDWELPVVIVESEPPPEVLGWFARDAHNNAWWFSHEPSVDDDGDYCDPEDADDIEGYEACKSPLVTHLLQPGQKIKASDLLKVQVQE